MSERKGWFADLSDPEERRPDCPWQAFAQVAGACHPLDGIWFQTREACEAFIRDELVGLGVLS